ncbi:MAG: damage-control phosphatase ARMT1 family protein [Thermoguttaceae bacterium]
MTPSLDCVVCLQRQCLEAARYATDDVALQAQILESAMKEILRHGIPAPSPIVGTDVHRLVREMSGVADPYYKHKKRFNRLALDNEEAIRDWIRSADDQFEATVRVAIAGNAIDFAIEGVSEQTVSQMIDHAAMTPLVGSPTELRREIENAENILYLADNAGEIVYDKFLVELLVSPEFDKSTTVVTRGAPIINDALLEDAEEIGLTKITNVVTNGGDGLGVIFDLVSDDFKERFMNADLVIAKGLANLESLWSVSSERRDKKIAFLFKAKCEFIAEQIGCDLGDLCIQIRTPRN